MQSFFLILAWLVAISFALILCYLAVELVFGLVRSKAAMAQPASGNLSGAIIVPAHNEAAGIARTIKSLRRTAPDCRILVVADNCSDDTARLAREAGAETVVRTDPEHKGKGYALAFGRDVLQENPPNVVLVVDADCQLTDGSAAHLISRVAKTGCPAQSVNLLEAEKTASPLVGISNFAMLVKNLVRARGLSRLGGGILLFGTGMAFPWTLFAKLDLATSEAVEDIHLGLALAERGIKISFVDEALVTSPAASVADSKGQRSRWEHGFLQAAVQYGIPFLFAGLRRRSAHLFAIGAHMMVPPLAMLMLLTFGALIVVGALSYGAGSHEAGHFAPLWVLLLSFGIAAIALLAAWWREGRAVLSFTALLQVPFYILWKIPIYLGFFTARQTDWNRTRREDEKP